jgi:ubiquinone/menaquinone biosynthesis C-methylase UbiE
LTQARYDGFADWYAATFSGSQLYRDVESCALRLLGPGPGRLLDMGCGAGPYTAAFVDAGWSVVGVDVSEDQLRLARERGLNVVLADAAALPFGDASLDAIVSIFTHTDIDEFAEALREAARVVRPRGRLVYVGAHPCFVGPHSLFPGEVEPVPTFHAGYYRDTSRRTEAPGITPGGLRIRVGARHLPLALFLQSFLNAGWLLERIEEPDTRDFPKALALRCRR